MPRIIYFLLPLFILIFSSAIILALDKEDASVTIGEKQIQVTLLKEVNDVVVIYAECVVPSELDHVWSILTDYENLKNMVPAVKESRIIEKNDNEIIVEQKGRSGFFIFRKNFSITYQVIEKNNNLIEFRAVKGDFQKFDGSWKIAPHKKGVLVHHVLEVKPNFYTPLWVMRLITKKMIMQSVENILKKCLSEEKKGTQLESANIGICLENNLLCLFLTTEKHRSGIKQ